MLLAHGACLVSPMDGADVRGEQCQFASDGCLGRSHLCHRHARADWWRGYALGTSASVVVVVMVVVVVVVMVVVAVAAAGVPSSRAQTTWR